MLQHLKLKFDAKLYMASELRKLYLQLLIATKLCMVVMLNSWVSFHTLMSDSYVRASHFYQTGLNQVYIPVRPSPGDIIIFVMGSMV